MKITYNKHMYLATAFLCQEHVNDIEKQFAIDRTRWHVKNRRARKMMKNTFIAVTSSTS